MKRFLFFVPLLGLTAAPVKAADANGPPIVEGVSQEAGVPDARDLHKTTPGEGAPAIAQVQGIVDAVDLQRHTLRIKDRTQKVWEVRIDPKTRIEDLENKDLELSRLRSHDKVNIYYNTHDFTARQIDLIPNLTEEALGAD